MVILNLGVLAWNARSPGFYPSSDACLKSQHWESRGERVGTEVQGLPQLRRGYMRHFLKKTNTLLLPLTHPPKNAYIKLTALLGARELDTLVVRSISCSQKGPRFSSQNPAWWLKTICQNQAATVS